MSTRGKKSTGKPKQNAAAVRSAGVSSGKKKAEQAKPPKPPTADRKDSHDGA